MGLVVGEEVIRSKEFYFFNFTVHEIELSNNKGISNRNKAYQFALSLQKLGLNPSITRKICYDSTRSGYITKKPEYEKIDFAQLEKLVKDNTPLPTIQEPIIESTYRC